jgi:hypothetical protein
MQMRVPLVYLAGVLVRVLQLAVAEEVVVVVIPDVLIGFQRYVEGFAFEGCVDDREGAVDSGRDV